MTKSSSPSGQSLWSGGGFMPAIGPFETSTVIGIGMLAGLGVFLATGQPEVAIAVAGIIKILLPENATA
jgi:hypothetical protein